MSYKLLQIQGKWYQERKPKKSKTWAKKKSQDNSVRVQCMDQGLEPLDNLRAKGENNAVSARYTIWWQSWKRTTEEIDNSTSEILQKGLFIMESPFEINNLEVPPFQETAIHIYIYMYISFFFPLYIP